MLFASAATRRLPLRSSKSASVSSISRSVLAPPRGGAARLRLRRPPSPSIAVVVSATSSDNADDNDLLYVAKFAASSFAGAALIKYGSMFISPPSSPDGKTAAALVVLPTLFYSLLLVLWSKKGDEEVTR